MTFALDLSVLRLLKDRKKFERYANDDPDRDRQQRDGGPCQTLRRILQGH
jgi:hypothetical protein